MFVWKRLIFKNDGTCTIMERKTSTSVYSWFVFCVAMGKKEEVKETIPILGRPGCCSLFSVKCRQ